MIEKLSKILSEKGITQQAFEAQAALPKNRISKWKDDQGEPSARQALRISQLLDVDVAWLISDDGPDEPPTPPDIPDDETQVLTLYRALGLDRDEALRRLATPTGSRTINVHTAAVREFRDVVANQEREAKKPQKKSADGNRTGAAGKDEGTPVPNDKPRRIK